MGRYIDITGLISGHLTIVKRVGSRRGQPDWECLCECGRTCIVAGCNVRSGRQRSCGCLRPGLINGRAKMPEWGIWKDALRRCYDPRRPRYPQYGGRGIYMVDRWRMSFDTFLADMGRRPSLDHSLDRIENDGPYSPENCRWATLTEQANNTRRNHMLSHDGKCMSIQAWEKHLGVRVGTLKARFYSGWSAERILTTPVRPLRRNAP